jgi:hypothetical protein
MIAFVWLYLALLAVLAVVEIRQNVGLQDGT